MKPMLFVCGLFAATLSLDLPGTQEPSGPAGHLVVVGGGGTPEDVVRRALALAGGAQARVIVLPQASLREGRGGTSVALWAEAGAREVRLLDDLGAEGVEAAIAGADLVWMPGGSQERLAAALSTHDLVAQILAAYRRGAVVGGTSAGAAVLSALMILGAPEEEGVIAGATPTGRGLGLLPEVVIDQHFIQRGRAHRLLQVVLEHPSLLGLGIDERTAVVVSRGREIEVLGESVAVVLDAREASIEPAQEGEVMGARGVRMELLRAGMTYELPGE